ncbi:MAG: hypothetical protein NTX57_09545 [Armatimonadetes bacterium]|jgi:hypothetical protein|nr:hypothetical protein [Armatimonadota bacterium]
MTETTFELHNRAMALAEEADAQRKAGEDEKADQLLSEAFLLEKEAAMRVMPEQENSEPSRSVLYRSAASLALECDKVRDAERLIAIALSGNPPEEIAEELRDLWIEVFRRLRPAEKLAA